MTGAAVNFNENDDYFTQKSLLKQIKPDGFDYDPATTEIKAKDLGIKHYDTVETDGLTTDWTPYRSIWINPPFTLKAAFLRKAVDTYERTRSDIFILFPISFLCTKKFHEIIGKRGGTLYLPDGRIRFETASGIVAKSPAFGSVILKIGDLHEKLIIEIIKAN